MGRLKTNLTTSKRLLQGRARSHQAIQRPLLSILRAENRHGWELGSIFTKLTQFERRLELCDKNTWRTGPHVPSASNEGPFANGIASVSSFADSDATPIKRDDLNQHTNTNLFVYDLGISTSKLTEIRLMAAWLAGSIICNTSSYFTQRRHLYATPITTVATTHDCVGTRNVS